MSFNAGKKPLSNTRKKRHKEMLTQFVTWGTYIFTGYMLSKIKNMPWNYIRRRLKKEICLP